MVYEYDELMHYTNEPEYDPDRAEEYEQENENIRELLLKKAGEICAECGTIFKSNERKYNGLNEGEYLHGECVDALVARMEREE